MLQQPRSTAIPRLLAAALLGLAMAGPAAAQDPLGEPARDTVPVEDVFAEMQAQLERLLPAMRELAISLQEALPELEGDAPAPDVAAVAQRAARFTRAYYEALLVEGFTREEALRIVSGGRGPPGR